METLTHTPTPADQADTAQPDTATSPARHHRTAQAWRQLRAAVQEINYVARRSVELQMRLPR
jgi:hypothetical protein